MIPRTFRQFDSKIVTGSKRVVDVLKELNDKYIGYRTEGIVYIDSQYRPSYHEIYFSYVENFNLEDSESEEQEEV